MSDYPSMATLQNNSQTCSYVDAVQRAKLVAAKISSSTKRSLEEGSEPSAKKSASSDSYQNQSMSASATAAAAAVAAAAAARIASSTSGQMTPQGPPGVMEQINEYIRVPNNMVGLIIGRNGEQITRLQAESGCKIQMAPDIGGHTDRVCTLTGPRDAINRAKDLVNQIVNHRGRENAPQRPENPGGSMPPMQRGGGGGGGGGGGLGLGLGTSEDIMLPGPKVGLIIGKNGKTIKQLQEQSGAKMVVIQDGPNTEFEKPLRISGDQEKVEHAKQLVYELLAEKDMQGGQRPPYDDYSDEQGNGLATNSTEVLVPKIAVGVVIGKGGDMIKKIQADTGCRVQFHQERDDGPDDKRCYLQGKPHQVQQARQLIEDLISSVNRREQEMRNGTGRGARMGGGQRNGDRGGGGGGGDFQQWQDAQEVRVTFSISRVKCGLIIGRGGEVIKQINAQSGAHCEMDRRAPNPDHNTRNFYIRGLPDAVETCKRIIMEKVGMPINFIQDGMNGGMGGGMGAPGGEYYGGGGGGGGAPPAWGYNPHWHQQPAAQPAQQQQVPINPATGQPDYSQQWIDYYRSLGLNQQAEAIEQSKQAGGAPGGAMPRGLGTSGLGAGAGSSAGAAAAAAGAAAQPAAVTSSAGGPDYSAQWAEYYRGIGKIKEAEAIEAQIKIKQQQQQQQQQQSQVVQAGQTAPPQSSGTPAPGAMPSGQYQYPMYSGSLYPNYSSYQYPGVQSGPNDHQQQW